MSDFHPVSVIPGGTMRAWNRTGSFGEIFAKSCISANDAKADIVVLKQRPPYEGQHHSGHGDPNHS